MLRKAKVSKKKQKVKVKVRNKKQMISSLTQDDLLNLIELICSVKNNNDKYDDTHIEVGQNYFIRTVTMHHIGRVVSINRNEFKLEGASWIEDSDRFHDALMTGELNEVEPFPDPVIVPRGCIVDMTPWRHALPLKQK